MGAGIPTRNATWIFDVHTRLVRAVEWERGYAINLAERISIGINPLWGDMTSSNGYS